MKKYIISVLSILLICQFQLRAQTLSPTAPAQGGTGQAGNTVLSYTIGQPLCGTLVGGSNIITMGYEQPEENITINNIVLNDTFYKGTQANISFTALGKYGPGNIFTVQLSGAGGNFGSPINISFDTAIVSGTVLVTLPLNIADGNYKMRIVSSYPSFTGGPSQFFAIRRMEIPRVPNGQIICSDSSTTATFNNIIVGNGGNEIEWSTNSSFAGGTYSNSPATITITVNPNTTDSIWVRSKDTLSTAFSDSIILIAKVDSLPNAIIYTTADTPYYEGNILLLHATGGVSYFWPQFGLDSSSISVVPVTDSAQYVVQVTGANGCRRNAYIRLSLTGSGVYPNAYIIDPDNPTDTIPINSVSGIVACHDILELSTLVETNPLYSYVLIQTFPQGITPALNSLKLQIRGVATTSVPAYAIGDTTLLSYSWSAVAHTLSWHIPGNAGSRNFTLDAFLYTDCSTVISGGAITTSYIYPVQDTFSSSIILPTITIPGVAVTFLNQTGNIHYAAPNNRTTEAIQICSNGDYTPSYVYGFTIQTPDSAVDSATNSNTILSLSGSDPYTATDTIQIRTSTPHIFNVTAANLNRLLGQHYLSPDKCVYTVVKIPAGSCSTVPKDTENYVFKIACNADSPSTVGITTADIAIMDSSSACAPDTISDNIWVTDQTSQYALSVSLSLIQNGATVSGVNVCEDTFTLNYKIANGTRGNTPLFPGANQKYVQGFSVFIDTSWINTSHLVVHYIAPLPGSADSIVAYTISNNTVVFNINNYVLSDSSIANIKLTGLTIKPNPAPILSSIHPAPVGPACMPTMGSLIGAASIKYKTECGEVYHATSSGYANTTIEGLTQSGLATGTYGPQVSPGISAYISFTWSQDNVNGNPWSFTSSGANSFFECTGVSYKAYLSLPVQLAFYDSAVVSYLGTGGNTILRLHYLGITADSNSIYMTDTLPGSGFGDGTIQVQVVLGDCSAFAAGGQVEPSLSLYATCKDDTCATYCFENIPSAVYVHCSGNCGGTGIGTDSLKVVNKNYPLMHSAYACDLVDFKVTGQGFNGAYPTPIPDSTKSITLQLTYLDGGGVNGQIFNTASPEAYLTYTQGGVTDTALTADYSISDASFNGYEWTITVTINGGIDLAQFKSFRAGDAHFTMDLYLPVFCNLLYDSLNSGVYSLNSLTASIGISGITLDSVYTDTILSLVPDSVTGNSCDPASATFEVISHQYGSSTYFAAPAQGASPCSETLVIVDSATGGTFNEMTGYQRSLINWPTGINDGFTVTYLQGMGIASISYFDSSGYINNYPIYDTIVRVGSDSVVTICGLKNGNTLFWPDYSKSGTEFLRGLIITFNQKSCGGDSVFVSIPHHTQDGKTTAQCDSGGCAGWITARDTAAAVTDSLTATPVISLTEPGTQIDNVPIDPLITQIFTLPLQLNNSTGLSPANIYISPNSSYLPLPGFGVDSNGIFETITVDTTGHTPTFTSLPGGNPIQFRISLDTNDCLDQTIHLPVGYTCSGLPTAGSFCSENNSASIQITIRQPQITIKNIAPSNSTTFADCKGACSDDELTLKLGILNRGTHAGPAYNPVLHLTDIGPGNLDIAGIQIYYIPAHGNGGNDGVNFAPGSYNSSFSLPLTGLNLPVDNSGNPYMLSGDSIAVIIQLFGDGNNCSPYAIFQTSLNFNDVCGHPDPLAVLPTLFRFNMAVCPPLCGSPSACASNDTFTTCNQCDLAPPISIEPTIKNVNPGCNGSAIALGSITLNVSGGPPLIDTVTLGNEPPNYTFSWSNGKTTQNIDSLSAGTYTVTVSTGAVDYSCTAVGKFTVDSSAITIVTEQSNPTCAGNNGSITAIASGITGDSLTYLWNNSKTTSSINGLQADTFTVTVTSEHCGAATARVILQSPPDNMTITFNTLNINCPGNPGAIAIGGITGGTVPYTYQWNYHDSTGNSISNLAAGAYTVTVTDNNQCTASKIDSVKTANDPPQLGTFNLSISDVCQGDTEKATITATGFANSRCIVYYHFFSNNNALFPVNHPDGAFVTTFDSDTVAFNQNGLGILSVSPQLFFDNVDSLVIDTISVIGHTGCLYSFSGDSSCFNNNGGKFSVLIFTSHYMWDPTTGLHNQETVCLGQHIGINFNNDGHGGFANNGSNYIWSLSRDSGRTFTILPNDGTYLPNVFQWGMTFTALDTGFFIYESVYTNPNTLCTISDSFKLHVVGIYASIDTPVVCSAYPTFPLRANPPGEVSYHWSASTDTLDTVTLNTPSVNTLYTVTVTDMNHCSASATRTIYPDSLVATLSAPADSVCGSIVLTFATTATGVGSRNPYTYSWNTGDSTQSITHNVSGGTTVTVTVTDLNGCKASATKTIYGGLVPSVTVSGANGSGCNGGIAIAHVTGGGAGQAYHWNNGGITDTISNLSSRTYIVTVTEANGCSASASDSITSITTGIIIAPPTDSFTCNKVGTVICNATGGNGVYTYLWNDSTTQRTITDTSIYSRSVYSVTVTDSSGCSATATFIIPALTRIDVSLHTYNSTCYGSIIASPTGGQAPFEYNWSNGDTSQNLSEVNSGLYTLTITDSRGCTATATDSVTPTAVHSCCFLYPVNGPMQLLTDTVLSSTLQDTLSDTSIYVGSGVTLIINRNLTLINCEVVLRANAQIVVNVGDTLQILGSVLHGCDTLWKGIYVYAPGSIDVDANDTIKSVIEDAITAITINGGFPGDDGEMKMMVWHTNFNRNQNGIVLNNFFPLDSSAYDISDCYFGMGGYTNMLLAPNGTANYSRPRAGIVVQWPVPADVTYGFPVVSIPNPHVSTQANAFEHMNIGIYSINSILNIYANSFDSIRNYETANATGYNGSAIVGAGSPFTARAPAFGSLTVQTSDTFPDSLSTIRFNNCDFGINAAHYTLTANNNRMENVTNGIYVQKSGGASIYGNYINRTYYGISLINNSGASQLVDTNTIHVLPSPAEREPLLVGPIINGVFIPVDTVYETTSLQTYGVYESEVSPSNTTIKHNIIYGGVNCIEMNNVTNTQVGTNHLHLNDPSPVVGPQSGIYSANGHDLLISGNFCDADSDYYDGSPGSVQIFPPASRFHKSGISLYNTKTGTVCNNTLGGSNAASGIGFGMLYSGDCGAVNLYSNNINQSWYGLIQQSSVDSIVIPSQPWPNNGTTYQNNDFSGPFTGTHATYSYDVPFSILFYFSTTYTPGSTYHPTNNGASPPLTEITFNGITDGSTNDCELITVPGPNHGNGDSIIAQNNIGRYLRSGFDTTAAKWLAEKMLFESLYGDTATLNNDNLFNSFFVRKDSSEMKTIILSELANKLLTDSATMIDTIASGGKPSGYADALARAQSLTSELPDSITQAANYKAMSTIYLNFVANGVDTFTSSQISAIESLALQCPYVAGDAVYMARSLYAQIDNTISFNDLLICQPSGSELRMLAASNPPQDSTTSITPKEFVYLYPNPAKQLVNLSFFAQTSGQVEFDLIDQLGQPVMKGLLSSGQTYAQYSVNSLSNGIYYWRLKDSQRTIRVGKIAVVK